MRKLALTVLGTVLLVGQLLAQTKTITGKVTDATGSPLPNVSIVVRGASVGTTTNADGTFSLLVNANVRALIISAVGFAEEEISLGDRTSIDIQLTSMERRLQEVVVVGYGTQRKRQVTAAIGKVDPGPIATLVTPSVDKQLGGRTPGLQVTNTSGLVNQAPRIRVRGVNSITGTRDPLIVIDGVPSFSGSFSSVANNNVLTDINPADIESIEVLKDGSATAIYGSSAANGVILITTKKGRSGKLGLTYTGTFGFSRPYQRFDLLNASEFVTIANEKFTNANQPEQAFLNSENTSTDWQDYVYRDVASSQFHTLSIDGGSDRATYFVSFNYADQEGMVITNKVKRYGVRANIDFRINKWLKIGNNLTLARTQDNDQNNGGNALSGAVANSLRSLPNVRVFDPNLPQFDNYNVTLNGAALGQDANLRPIENNYTNIGFVLNHNKYEAIKNRVLNNLYLEIKPVRWLTFTSRAAIDYLGLSDFQSWDNRHGDGRGSNGYIFNQSGNTLRWNLQNYFNYVQSFGMHNFNFTLGTESSLQESKFFNGQGTGISDIFFIQQNIITGTYLTQFSGGSYTKAPGFTSYFTRLNYDYASKYFLQLTFRRDGLSRFSEENRFGNFPGVSAGWRLSEENFWKQGSLGRIFNEAKIRASWARVGNVQISGGLFPYLSLYGTAPYGAINGIAPSSVGNPDLQWETNQKYDIGLDLSMFNNRVNFTFDWFRNNNNEQVLDAPLPPSFGVPGNVITRNIGDLESTGYEVAVNGTIFQSKDFSWDLGVNYTHVTNKVKSLYLDQDVISGYNILRVGQPINAIYGYQFVGVNSGNGNPMYAKEDGTLIQGNIENTTYYTVIKNDDPSLGTQTTLSGTDRAVLGNVLPTYFGGISTSFRYKNFSLDMLWRYSGGNYIMNITKQEALVNQAFQNNGKEILDRWRNPGDMTDVPKLWYGRDNFTNLQQSANSRFVEKGDFVKLDNLQLSYGMNTQTLSRLTNGNIKSFRFFIQGQNLLLLTDYSGIDPENITEGGLDNNTVPQPRALSIGLSVGL